MRDFIENLLSEQGAKDGSSLGGTQWAESTPGAGKPFPDVSEWTESCLPDRLANLPGLWIGGSSYYGVAMNACFEKAPKQAGEILRYLTSTESS